MLLDLPIRLTHGAGNGVDKACLMTATNMLIGRGADGDDCSCVCPVLRAFIIPTNDNMPEDLLGELYGPLAWEIIGTRTSDINVMVQRAELLAGVAQEIAAKSAASAAFAAFAAEFAAESAAYAAFAAESAASAAFAAESAAKSAASAAESAASAASAAFAAESRAIWTKCRDAIRAAAAIGDKRPVECVITPQQLCESLT